MDSDTGTKLADKLPGHSEFRPLLDHFGPPRSGLSDKRLGLYVSVAVVIGAVTLGLMVLYHINYYPRTDDAEVFANFIGIAPQVEGPILRLTVHDNQFVKQGELLFEIDERPYQYALERAISDQAALEGQISDEQ